MRDVVTGVGQTRRRALGTIAAPSCPRCHHGGHGRCGYRNRGCAFVGNMLSGELSGQEHLGVLVADFIMRGMEAMKVEAAAPRRCSGPGGLAAVASGIHEVVMVCGGEDDRCDQRHRHVRLAMAADQEYEVSQGNRPVGLNALFMRRYMHQFGGQTRGLRRLCGQRDKNGYHNPNAMFQPDQAGNLPARRHDC